MPSGNAAAFTIRSRVLGVPTNHLTINSATNAVTANQLSAAVMGAGLLRLGVLELPAAANLLIPTTQASIVRVMPAAGGLDSIFFTLASPGSGPIETVGLTLLLSNHASSALQHSDGLLDDLPSGHAAQFVFLGGNSWLQLQSRPFVLLT